ncbi:hypothetical protein [Aquimarina litoralis]|uniref:hypothetical protein n=1 Tax=Aquimarina litoralis TaxID=584605 RepID=UPI001C563F36|nr:hypothetical protein [Aquimarina litoralis]MBW1297921.1 hypothetical protein [Aquimarina litoralis]
MNFDLLNELTKLLHENELERAIELSENKLNELPSTDFHKVLNKNLLHLKPKLAIYLENFITSAIKYFSETPKPKKINFLEKVFGKKENKFESNVNLKAVYCEMNGFTINNDKWFIDLFAYDFYNGMDPEDLDWLCDFKFDSNNSLIITGLEELQAAFKNYMEHSENNNENEKKSMEICELIIILKLQELFRHTYIENNKKWTEIPILVTAHDYEMIYKIEK